MNGKSNFAQWVPQPGHKKSREMTEQPATDCHYGCCSVKLMTWLSAGNLLLTELRKLLFDGFSFGQLSKTIGLLHFWSKINY